MSGFDYPRVKLAVSNCLLGSLCRYNGGHAQDGFISEQLAQYVDYIPFCPEDAVMGTPRESVRLCRIEGRIHVLGGRSQTDYTAELQAYNQQKIVQLQAMQIDGALVKAKSPSCGLDRIKIYRPTGEWLGSDNGIGQGLFTQALQQAMPWLAIEDEGRMQDAWLKENFMLQVFAQARWRTFVGAAPSVADFQAFHRRHKFLLLSKNEALYRQMGPLVAQATAANLALSLADYELLLHQTLATKSRIGAMINVVEHLYGYVKASLSPAQKGLYQETREEFRQGVIPLIVLMKLLQQWIAEFEVDYLADQWILAPYPSVLALRSDCAAFKVNPH